MSKTFIISEIGINHNGDLKIAKEMIDASIRIGVDAVKFQKRDIKLVYSEEQLKKPRTSPFGTTERESIFRGPNIKSFTGKPISTSLEGMEYLFNQ